MEDFKLIKLNLLKIFDYIHSLDSEKLAIKFLMNKKNKKKPKIFIQVNIGNEDQKSGINKEIR